MLKIKLHNLLVIYISYIFLICNVLAAHIPTRSLVFIAIRDLWIFIFIFILINDLKNKVSLVTFVFIAFWGLLGVTPLLTGEITSGKLIVYLYGFRDICLIGFVFYILKAKIAISNYVKKSINIFVGIVLITFTLQIIFQILGLEHITEFIYQYKIYYQAKGIDINLDGGIFGMRPGAPLYSPGLVATLLSFYILSRRKSIVQQVLTITISFFTLSKVIVLIVIFKVFRKIYFWVVVGLFLFLTLIISVAETLKENYPNSIYSYHAHSITEHLGFTQYFNSEDNTLLPDLLGSSSIAGALILGNDPSESAESLFVSKLKDYNWLSLFFIVFFIYFLFTLDKEKRFYFVVFLLLQLFTGMSNHPVCYIPLYLIFNEKVYAHEKRK